MYLQVVFDNLLILLLSEAIRSIPNNSSSTNSNSSNSKRKNSSKSKRKLGESKYSCIKTSYYHAQVYYCPDLALLGIRGTLDKHQTRAIGRISM